MTPRGTRASVAWFAAEIIGAEPSRPRGGAALSSSRASAAALLLDVWYALGHEVRRHSGPLMRACGLVSLLQVVILDRLSRQGDRRLVDLAHDMQCPLSTLSESTERLVADGLVRRQPNPEDRRSFVLAPTELGRAALTRMQRGLSDHVTELMGDLDDEAVAELLARLPQVAALLHARGGEGWAAAADPRPLGPDRD